MRVEIYHSETATSFKKLYLAVSGLIFLTLVVCIIVDVARHHSHVHYQLVFDVVVSFVLTIGPSSKNDGAANYIVSQCSAVHTDIGWICSLWSIVEDFASYLLRLTVGSIAGLGLARFCRK